MTEGKADVVVGTHRLLSPDTRFARLGLVILDEEQRFGVEHKEYLKRLRTEVDVLAMSATPIPRTLEMGVAGIREMSTILTPPEERHPVLTFVGPQDEKQTAAAICFSSYGPTNVSTGGRSSGGVRIVDISRIPATPISSVR